MDSADLIFVEGFTEAFFAYVYCNSDSDGGRLVGWFESVLRNGLEQLLSVLGAQKRLHSYSSNLVSFVECECGT